MASRVDVELAISMLEAGVADFEEAVLAIQRNDGAWSAELLGELLVALANQTDVLKSCAGALETLLARQMDRDQLLVVPGGVFESKWSSPRKRWNHAQLKTVVAEKVLERAVDPDTGAVLAPPSQLIREAFEVVGISYWKVGELKGLGVNADHYCEKEPGKPTIIMRRSGGPQVPDPEE